MKKSSIKYLGVTAAALLAVAPIAAPAAVASIAPSQTVSAAEATDEASILKEVKGVVSNVQNSSTDASDDNVTSLFASKLFTTGVNTYAALQDDALYSAIKAPNYAWNNQVANKTEDYTYKAAPASGSLSDLQNEIQNNNKLGKDTTANITFAAYKGDSTTATASTTVTVTFKHVVDDAKTLSLTQSFADTTAQSGDPISNYNITTNAAAGLSIKDGNGNAVKFTATSAVVKLDGTAQYGNFDYAAGKNQYTQDLTVTLTGYKKTPTFTDGKTVATPVAGQADTYTATFTRNITVYDKTSDQQPLFVQTVNGVATTLANGATITPKTPVSVAAGTPASDTAATGTTAAVVTSLTSALADVTAQNSSDDKTAIDIPTAINAATTKAALTKAGLTFNDKGVITSVGKFVVPVTVTNPTSGKTATVNVPLTITAANTDSMPVWMVDSKAQDTQIVKLTVGDKYDNLSDLSVSQSKENTTLIPSSEWTISGDTVDTSKAGTYTVNYTAKNANGYTSTFTRVVIVSASTGSSETPETGTVYVNYVPGYGIAVWNTYKDGRKITGTKLQHGTAWKYYKTATINGEKWYNLGGDQWIQAQYTSATKPGNTGSEIEKIDGTVKVNYVPGYGIAIWGKPAADVTSKKLAHGTSWKVFAKTSVNGTTWYNLGGNQWVDGTYAKLQ